MAEGKISLVGRNEKESPMDYRCCVISGATTTRPPLSEFELPTKHDLLISQSWAGQRHENGGRLSCTFIKQFGSSNDCLQAHRSKWQSRDVKKMPMESEGAMKISAPRASKRAPT